MPECDIKGEKCGYQCTGYDGSHKNGPKFIK